MNDNRFRLSRYKSLIIVLLIGLTSKVSAQSILQSPIGSGFGILDTLNQFLLFPLTTYQDLGIFIAIWAGFYYATKPILNEMLTGMLEVFPSVGDDGDILSGSSRTSSDTVKRSVRGLSLVAGFVAAQYLGWMIGGLALIIIGGLSLVAIAAYMIWGTTGFLGELTGNGQTASDGGTGARNPPSSSSGGAEIDQLQNRIGSVEQELGNVENIAKSVDQELREIAREENDLESMKSRLKEMVNGNKLSRDEAQQLSQIINETEEVDQLEEKVENFVENVIKEEEHIADLEEHISQLEADMESGEADVSQIEELIDQKIQEIRAEYESAKKEKEELAEEEKQGEVDPERYQAMHEDIEQKMRKAHRGAQKVGELVTEGMNKDKKIEQEAEETEKEVQEAESEVEDAEEKLGQTEEPISQEEAEVKDEEQKTEDLPEGDVPTTLPEVEKEEQEVAAEEEEEVKEAEEVAQGEAEIANAEEQELAKLENVLGSQEQDLQKYSQEAQEIAKQSEQQLKELQQMDEVEERESQYNKRSIGQISKKLNSIRQRQRNGGISEKEAINEAKAAKQRLEEIRNQTQNQDELRQVQKFEALADRIIKRQGQKSSEEVETEKEAEQLALEAQQFAGALPSGQEQNVIQQAKNSFNDAGQVWFNPNKQKSIDQATGWIWNQQEILEGLEEIKQNHQGDQQKIQEAERLEEGLVHIINRLCKERGIDRSQFTFLQ